MNREQLQAILWLRWQLTRNQFVRRGQISAVLSVLMLVMMIIGGLGCAVGGLVLGALVAAKAPPSALMFIWDGVLFGFLVFWMTGLLVEIQRSESIDLTKLLHLPVTLRQVFVFNYVASHFTPSIVVLLPGMLGLCAGLTFGAGVRMVLMFPLLLGLVFLITAWTYCLRGWLAALMVNKRRRRAIIVWITLGLVLLGQLPNIVVNSSLFRHRNRPNPEPSQRQAWPSNASQGITFGVPVLLTEAHLAIPPGWVGYGAMDLKDGNVLPAMGLAAASWLIGAFGLMRAYRLTIRFYQGAEKGAKPRPAVRRTSQPSGRLLVERRLPWLPEDTVALALATFRSLSRAPELKMAFIMPVVVGAALSSAFFARPKHSLPEFVMAFAATAAVVLAAFSTAPIMSNAFGLDRNGFRALVLLPTRRHHILLAKNLAFFPFTALISVIFLVLVEILLRLSWRTLLAGLLQVPTAFLLFSLLCNLLSILCPYRVVPGSLQAKKPKAVMIVAMFATLLMMPVLLLPIGIPAGLQILFSSLGWVPWLPVNVLAAAALLAGVAWVYGALLPLQGRLLQKREQVILREVTEEIE